MKNGCNKMGEREGCGDMHITWDKYHFIPKILPSRGAFPSASTLIKKKTKFSSYIRKVRWDRVQNHMHPIPLNFLTYEENFIFLFISVVLGLLVLIQLAQGRKKKP
jgi:hypothetical protein